MRSSPARMGFTAWVEDLARAHTDELVATAVRAGLSGEVALEAVREAFETFLILPQARSLADHPRDVSELLAIIVRNVARRRPHPHPAAAPAVEPAVLDDSPSVATLIAAADQHIVMRGCVRRLAEIQSAVVMLRALEEIAGGDAAQQLGLHLTDLARLQHRAKAALQANLAE